MLIVNQDWVLERWQPPIPKRERHVEVVLDHEGINERMPCVLVFLATDGVYHSPLEHRSTRKCLGPRPRLDARTACRRHALPLRMEELPVF